MQDPCIITGHGIEAPARTEASIAEVRAWARKKGLQVGSRGHLTESLIRAYNRSHHRHAVSSNPKASSQ